MLVHDSTGKGNEKAWAPEMSQDWPKTVNRLPVLFSTLISEYL